MSSVQVAKLGSGAFGTAYAVTNAAIRDALIYKIYHRQDDFKTERDAHSKLPPSFKDEEFFSIPFVFSDNYNPPDSLKPKLGLSANKPLNVSVTKAIGIRDILKISNMEIKKSVNFDALSGCLRGAHAALIESGLTHNDIKPENVFYHGDAPKLGDFGLVAATHESTLKGSPFYQGLITKNDKLLNYIDFENGDALKASMSSKTDDFLGVDMKGGMKLYLIKDAVRRQCFAIAITLYEAYVENGAVADTGIIHEFWKGAFDLKEGGSILTKLWKGVKCLSCKHMDDQAGGFGQGDDSDWAEHFEIVELPQIGETESIRHLVRVSDSEYKHFPPQKGTTVETVYISGYEGEPRNLFENANVSQMVPVSAGGGASRRVAIALAAAVAVVGALIPR